MYIKSYITLSLSPTFVAHNGPFGVQRRGNVCVRVKHRPTECQSGLGPWRNQGSVFKKPLNMYAN